MTRWGWLALSVTGMIAGAAVTFALLLVDTLLEPFFRWPKED